jgi:hypothetical protein
MNDNQIKKPQVVITNINEKLEVKPIVEKIVELIRVKHLQS